MTTATTHASGLEHHIRSTDAHLSPDHWTLGTVSHYIGKCRICKHAVRVDVRQDVRLGWEWCAGNRCYISTRQYQYEALTPGASYHASKQGHYVVMACPQGCIERHARALFTCKRIDGHHNPSVACNMKCLSATGPQCECSCAGDNHGAGHSL